MRKILMKDSVNFSRRKKRNMVRKTGENHVVHPQHRDVSVGLYHWRTVSSAKVSVRWQSLAFASDPWEFKKKLSSNKCVGIGKKKVIASISRTLWVVVCPLKQVSKLALIFKMLKTEHMYLQMGELCLLEPEWNLYPSIYLVYFMTCNYLINWVNYSYSCLFSQFSGLIVLGANKVLAAYFVKCWHKFRLSLFSSILVDCVSWMESVC